MSAPPEMLSGERLAGWADVSSKVQQSQEATLYRVAFYVDVKGAFEVLEPFAGLPHEELAIEPAFFAGVSSGRFCKSFRLEFLRSLQKAEVQALFEASLMHRVGGAGAEDASHFVAVLPDVMDQDVLTLRFDADGENLLVDFPSRYHRPAVTFHSPALWLGLQRSYFDENELQGIKVGASRLLPELLSCAEHDGGEGRERSSSKSWREFAGRKEGKDGYKFGDLTRGFMSKATDTRPHSNPRESSQEPRHRPEEVYLQEIAQLRSDLELLQGRCAHEQGSKEARATRSFQVGTMFGSALSLLVALVAHAVFPPESLVMSGRLWQAGLAVAIILLCACATAFATGR
mmetsp:Transcript_15555/g.24857  ORF Transcript_15555/g.24857 Transcript_15555/m.24857 type:complete len:345 (-) Transcript_15555:32-1066(-)